MKKIFCFMMAIILIVCLGVVPVFAEGDETLVVNSEESAFEDDVTETVCESNAKTESDTIVEVETLIESGTAFSAVVETEENTTSKMWNLIKTELTKDVQFWALMIMCLVMVIVVIAVMFVLLASTNPTQRKSMRGMNKAVEIVSEIQGANSETLEKIYLENKEKTEKILELKEQIVDLNKLTAKERRNLAMALAYDMRIHKLVCDRLAMPVNDKSLIDTWYARGIDLLKENLDEDDIKKIESLFSILDTVGTGI